MKKSILVIGGGAAGSQIAYQLRDLARVILVEPKTYWEVPMAVPRLLVQPDALNARVAFNSFLASTEHVAGKVVALTDTVARVALNEGGERELAFDYAVVASGSAYIDPLIKAQARTEPERKAEIRAMNDRLRAARSVVVVGGGPVGIETAAELRETFPNLAVTVVHAGSKLLERAPDRFPRWAEKSLREKGVKILLGDSVRSPATGEQPVDGKVVTAAGMVIEADSVVWAVGTKPQTGFVAHSWPETVQPDGQLKVDRFLRLENHPTIFVAGDVTNLPEGRLAIVGGLHAKSVVANLKTLVATPAGTAATLKPYKPALPGKGMGRLMIVTLGREDGLTSLPSGQFRAGFLARKIKSRDMLVGMSRKALGLAA